MSITIAAIELKTIACAACSMDIYLSPAYVQQRRDDHQTFFCPAGHSNYFPEQSSEEKLRDRLARETHGREQAEARARHNADRAERSARSAAAYKGQATKLKRRVSRGVCPCCNRTFADLAQHMAGQHPDWVEVGS